MEKREEQKKINLGPKDSPECLVSISEECTPPNTKNMSPEEMKAYLDDLFSGDLFSEG
jgi:hypothetical protein